MTNSERRVQRVRKALDPPGEARDDIEILCRAGPHGWATPGVRLRQRRGGLGRAALAVAHAPGDDLPAARGARRHPVAVLRARTTRARSSCTAGCGRSRCAARGRRSGSSSTSRRSTSSTTTSRCGSPPGGGSTRTTPACRAAAWPRRCAGRRRSTSRRRTRAASASSRASVVQVSSRRGTVVAPVRVDPDLRPGLVFMTFHFPDQVDTNLLTIDATDPRSGTAEFKAAAIRIDKLRSGVGAGPRPRDHPRGVALMDLRIHGAEATEEERAAVDGMLGPPLTGWVGGARAEEGERTAHGGHDAREQRHLLLPTLHAVHDRIGWISPGALDYVCRAPDRPAGRGLRRRQLLRPLRARAARAHGRSRLQRHRLHVPRRRRADARARGAGRPARRAPGQRPRDLARAPCLGLCERAPAAMVTHSGEDAYEHVIAPAGADAVLEALAAPPLRRHRRLTCRSQTDRGLRLLRRVGLVDPAQPRRLPGARRLRGAAAGDRARPAGGGRRGHRRRASSGRGGAAFPTGRKWDAVARRPVRRITWSATPTSPSRARSRTAS